LEPDLNKLKIAFISDQQYPIDKADSEQTVNTVSALASAGLNVSLIIPKRWRHSFRSNRRLKQELLEYYAIKDGFDLVALQHCPLTPVRAEKYFHGLLGPLYATIAKYDLIFTRNPWVALTAVALRKQLIFETYRLYDRKNTRLTKLLVSLLHHDRVIGIITHSEASKGSLIRRGVAEEKIAVMHNGFNSDHLVPRLSKLEARGILGWDKQEKIACYTGSIHRQKGIEHLLDIARKTPEINYYFIGKDRDPAKLWFKNEVAKRRLKNVRKLRWVRQHELPNYLFASDLLLIPPTAAPLMKYGKTVLPIKVFVYLGAGRPILAPVLPDNRDVLNEQNAVLVKPDDVDSAVAAVRRVFAEPVWADAIAAQAMRDSQRLTWSRRAEKIKEFIAKQLAVSRDKGNGRDITSPDKAAPQHRNKTVVTH